MDTHTKKQRSDNMRAIRSKNTKPEIKLRSLLHNMGFRYRLHRKDLPGTPDIVLTKYKTVIDIRGCFWHRHEGCVKTTDPKTNSNYWEKKFKRNVQRDRQTENELKELGWKVIVVWECEMENIEEVKNRILKELLKEKSA